MASVKIGDFIIDQHHKPFVIAEMSGNHNQSLERALAIVDAAADAGAHAIKLQTYTADTITIDAKDGLFTINDKDSLWKGKNLYELYKMAYTPWEWHKPIFDHAKKRGMLAFSSPFDETAVDFLESLDVPAYKIASFENTHWPLIKKVIKTGKPVIISTGISTLTDLNETVGLLRSEGCENFVLLKCTSTYPANPENSNILTIPHMSTLFNCHVGLSDHTMGVGVAVASVVLGARVIEKHMTMSRAEGGVDSAFSLEPHEFKLLVEETERAFLALGNVKYGIQDAEKNSVRFKRSVYVVKDIKKGEAFTSENIRVIRPGDGLHPKNYETLQGMFAASDLAKGTPLNWKHIAEGGK